MPRLILESAGLGVSVQDAGRIGFRKLGVPLSGALDRSWLDAANLLAGAPEGSAALEVLLTAPVFRVEQGPLRLGLAGALVATLTRDGQEQRIEGWRSLTLQSGDRLALKLLRAPAYIAFSGGLDGPEILGSRSTYARAGLGKTLAAGDLLCCGEAEGEDFSAKPLSSGEGPLRFILGPEIFPPDTLAAFAASAWNVRPESDRMGLRLTGPRLVHGAGGPNIVSEGVTPGAIQIPGDGQPIVLRADGQTSGGYARIGSVISADLDRLAHALPGDALRFAPVDLAQAAQARREKRECLALWRQSLLRVGAGLDEDRLWSENLIGGAILGE